MNKRVIYIALKNMGVRKKDIILTLILLTVTWMIFFMGFTFVTGLESFLQDVVYEIPLVKTLVFNVDESQEEKTLSTINDALLNDAIMEGNYYLNSVFGEVEDERFATGLLLHFNNKAYSKFVKMSKDMIQTHENAILFPKYYSMDTDFDDNVLISKQPKFIDGNSFVGEEILIKFTHFDNDNVIYKSFIVTGTYDNSLSFDETNQALVSYDQLKELHEALGIQNGGLNSFYVIANEYHEIDQVIHFLRQKLNIESNISPIFNFTNLTTFMSFSKLIVLLVGLLLLMSSLIYISTSTLKNIERRSIEVGMLKVLGYNSKQIKHIFIFENLIITVSAFLVSVILYAITIVSLNLSMDHYVQYQLKNIQIAFHPVFALTSFSISFVLILIISTLKVKKIEALNSIDILKSSGG